MKSCKRCNTVHVTVVYIMKYKMCDLEPLIFSRFSHISTVITNHDKYSRPSAIRTSRWDCSDCIVTVQLEYFVKIVRFIRNRVFWSTVKSSLGTQAVLLYQYPSGKHRP